MNPMDKNYICFGGSDSWCRIYDRRLLSHDTPETGKPVHRCSSCTFKDGDRTGTGKGEGKGGKERQWRAAEMGGGIGQPGRIMQRRVRALMRVSRFIPEDLMESSRMHMITCAGDMSCLQGLCMTISGAQYILMTGVRLLPTTTTTQCICSTDGGRCISLNLWRLQI